MTKLIVKHYHKAGHHVTRTNQTLANLLTKLVLGKKYESGKRHALSARDAN